MSPIRLTNSEMSTFRLCRRDWYLRYYREFVPIVGPAAGSPLSIGTAFHDALASYYDQFTQAGEALRSGKPAIAPVHFVGPVYARAIENEPHRQIELENEQELVTLMLDGYGEWLESEAADADLRVLAPETMLEKPLVVGADGSVLATLLSKIDARVEKLSTGERLALEHKTCQSLKQALPLLQCDTQLLTEHLLEMLDIRDRGASVEDASLRAQGVLYNMSRKVKRTASAKPPFYGREQVVHNVQELRSHWAHCQSTALQILDCRARLDAGESHQLVCPPSPSRELTWKSGFFKYYVLMNDGSDWERAVLDEYKVGDALERYAGTKSYEGE